MAVVDRVEKVPVRKMHVPTVVIHNILGRPRLPKPAIEVLVQTGVQFGVARFRCGCKDANEGADRVDSFRRQYSGAGEAVGAVSFRSD